MISIIAISTPVIAAEPDRILMVDIMAKGDDEDIPPHYSDDGIYRATTLIVGKIRFDEVSGVGLGQVEFHVKIYEIESGEKVYTIKGKFKDGAVMLWDEHYCPVREVTWTNIWVVVGEGMIKTTDTVIENFEYRGNKITLPNTGGKYIPITFAMMVSPNGDNLEGKNWDGWAYAGIPYVFGGVTWLTRYIEK